MLLVETCSCAGADDGEVLPTLLRMIGRFSADVFEREVKWTWEVGGRTFNMFAYLKRGSQV